MNKTENNSQLVEFSHIPVSSKGQVTLSKSIREHLNVKAVNRMDGAIIIEPDPTVDSLFGILKPSKSLNPANAYEVREKKINERLRDYGYTMKNETPRS